MRGVLVGAALGVVTTGSVALADSNYPPRDTDQHVVEESPQTPTGFTSTPAELPQTGSDSMPTVKMAGVALVAGVGLIVVSGARRRAAAQ